MSDYRPYYVPGGTYFFTVVAHQRRPLFSGENARSCLRQAILDEQQHRPFNLFAICLLPDHIHSIWTLPRNDDQYSIRWSKIKEEFTRSYLNDCGTEGQITDSRKKHRERAVWQRRFWEHTVKDEDDLKRCADYIHWNPVKHRLVSRVRDWPWSSFHRFVEAGEYEIDWGRSNPCIGYDAPEWE